KAVANVANVLAPAVVGLPASEQEAIDRRMCELDGTPNKSRLGANAILGVSLAAAHAAAAVRGVPLWRHLSSFFPSMGEGRSASSFPPTPPDTGGGTLTEAGGRPVMPLPMVNMISGGLHAGGNLEFQDFLFLPIGARSFCEALEMTVRVYRALSATLTRHGFEGVLVGDAGGFGPRLRSNEQSIEMILEAIAQAGYEPG